MHQRPLNKVENPASGPLFSVPATGWAGIIVAVGRTAVNASTTLCLHDPTSLTIASAGRSSANSAATAPIAPTGTHRITRSASITDAPAVSVTSSQMPSATERARTTGSTSCPITRTEGICALTARATDEPIRPSPIIVRRAKGSIRRYRPEFCARQPSRRDFHPRCQS